MTPDLLRSALTTTVSAGLPPYRYKSYRRAAVMVVVYGAPPVVVMTAKPAYLKLHAGEISFPGGKLEDCDAGVMDAAIRETREEISLHINHNQMIGMLDAVTTLTTGFVIVPYVAVLTDRPVMTPNSEVARILEIPLGALLDTVSPDTDPEHNAVQGMYTFTYGTIRIWGASARILKQMHDLICKQL